MIITLASSKGGVGKSTTTATLAGSFVSRGLRTHIIDLDTNRTVSRWLSDDAIRPPLLTLSAPDPNALTEHLQQLQARSAVEAILIDIAGTYESALTLAIARSNLTIIPACTTEADIYEATRVAAHIQRIFQAFGQEPLYRLLLTRVQPLTSLAQQHAYREIRRLQIPLFGSLLVHRAAYEEIGLSGQTPHFADAARPTVAKAIAEVDKLTDEIFDLLQTTYGLADTDAHHLSAGAAA